MSLEAEIEETKKLLAEAQAKEGEEFEDEEQTAVEETEEEAVEEPEAKVEEPVKEEVKEEPKEQLDDSGYARLRREKAAAEKLAREKEQELADLRAQLAAKQEPAQEVEAPQLPPELQSIIEKERYNQAGREFNAYEDQFRRKTPDYDDVSNAYKQALAQSIKIQNPRISVDELIEKTNETLLKKAGSYLRAGFDPIEEMYHEAKELGFKAIPKEAPKEEPAKDLKPDLAKVAANKARNAGTAGAKGAGERGQITLAAAADMNVMEWANLPAAEKKRILAGG
jgi:hypothetical protein